MRRPRSKTNQMRPFHALTAFPSSALFCQTHEHDPSVILVTVFLHFFLGRSGRMGRHLRYFLGIMWIVAVVTAWQGPQFARAGSSVVGQVFPTGTIINNYISGIAFDGGPN